MLKRWDQAEAGRAERERPPKDPKFQKKLRQRVLKGIPNRLRGQVWTRLAQTEELRARQGGSIFDPVRSPTRDTRHTARTGRRMLFLSIYIYIF